MQGSLTLSFVIQGTLSIAMKKRGGGIVALISTMLIKTRLKLAKNQKTLEHLAFEIKTNTGNMVIIGIY